MRPQLHRGFAGPLRAQQSHVSRTDTRPHRPPPLSPSSQFFSQSYESNLPTSLIYIVLSTRGFKPWRPDAVMSTAKRVAYFSSKRKKYRTWFFKECQQRTGHLIKCKGALPTANNPIARQSASRVVHKSQATPDC